MKKQDVERAAKDLEKASPLTILEWASGYAGNLAMSSSFGIDSSAMLSLASQLKNKPTILFVNTGYHFEETLQYGSLLCKELGLTYLNVTAKMSVKQHEIISGKQYETNPDACCNSRKVQPLDVAITKFNGWITGIRRSQTFLREETPVVALESKNGKDVLKVAPIATWSSREVEIYRAGLDLPNHPLWEKGYKSVGCAPCTTPVTEGEDPRNGRWRKFSGKTECGLHLDK